MRRGHLPDVWQVASQATFPPDEVSTGALADGASAAEDMELETSKVCPGRRAPDCPSSEAKTAHQLFAILMGDEVRCQGLADLFKPKDDLARFHSSQEVQMAIFDGEEQGDTEDVLFLGRWRGLLDGQSEAKDVDDLEGQSAAVMCGFLKVAPEEVINVARSRDEEHRLDDVLKGASESVPSVDGCYGSEGHCKEGGFDELARGRVSDENPCVLKVVLKERAAAVGGGEVTLQKDEVLARTGGGNVVEASLEVADAAHAYGSQDVSRVVDEAFSEVIDAAYFDVAFGVDLKDAKSSSQE